MNCLVCGQKAGMSATKLKNGRICKSCASKLPSLMIANTPYIQEGTLTHAMEYVRYNMEKFCATATYGELAIDSMHGLFAIAKKYDKDGKPLSGNNVFSAYDLSDVGIYCGTPHVDHNNVFADIEFKFELENPRMIVSTKIKKNAKCYSKKADSTHLEWDEPHDLAMFRTLFSQMLSGVFEDVQSLLCGKTVHEFEVEKAMAIFMLPEDYSISDLKKARRLMMKVYHPDKGEDDVTREAQIINDAYDLLKAELEQNGVDSL